LDSAPSIVERVSVSFKAKKGSVAKIVAREGRQEWLQPLNVMLEEMRAVDCGQARKITVRPIGAI
jgi:hypothetical protein